MGVAGSGVVGTTMLSSAVVGLVAVGSYVVSSGTSVGDSGESPGASMHTSLRQDFYTLSKIKLVSTRSVWIRASLGAEKRMERSSAPSPKGLPDVFIETSGSTFCESATCIRCFVRRASGGCVDCREPSLTKAKNGSIKIKRYK